MNALETYLANVPNPQKKELKRICNIVRKNVPEAEEVITYGMPGFKYKGKYLIAFAAFKDHLSIFPGSGAIDTLKDELAGYKLSKGTIQFTLQNQLPEPLIKKIIELRVNDINKS